MTYKSILCLNGDIPDTSFFSLAAKVPLISADGAANALIAQGLIPNIIIGDLDSVQTKLLKTIPYIHVYDQNYCDYEKCLHYMEAHDLLPTLIVGINGKRLDHILNNVNIFIQMKGKHLFYAPPFYGLVLQAMDENRVLDNCSISIKTQPNTIISLLGMPYARALSRGLKWELDGLELSFPGQTSCLNQTITNEVNLQVLQGTILVLIEQNTPPTIDYNCPFQIR